MRYSFVLIILILLCPIIYGQKQKALKFTPHFFTKIDGGYSWRAKQLFDYNPPSLLDRQTENIRYAPAYTAALGYQFNKIANVNLKAIHAIKKSSALTGLFDSTDPTSDSLLLNNEISESAYVLNFDVNIPVRNLPWFLVNIEMGLGMA